MILLLGQSEHLGIVVIIIACAVGGIIGTFKLIKHFSPNVKFSNDPIVKKLEEQGLEMLLQLIIVPVIMACATFGTIGLLKLIKQSSSNGDFPKDPFAKKLEEQVKKMK